MRFSNQSIAIGRGKNAYSIYYPEYLLVYSSQNNTIVARQFLWANSRLVNTEGMVVSLADALCKNKVFGAALMGGRLSII